MTEANINTLIGWAAVLGIFAVLVFGFMFLLAMHALKESVGYDLQLMFSRLEQRLNNNQDDLKRYNRLLEDVVKKLDRGDEAL